MTNCWGQCQHPQAPGIDALTPKYYRTTHRPGSLLLQTEQDTASRVQGPYLGTRRDMSSQRKMGERVRKTRPIKEAHRQPSRGI